MLLKLLPISGIKRPSDQGADTTHSNKSSSSFDQQFSTNYFFLFFIFADHATLLSMLIRSLSGLSCLYTIDEVGFWNSTCHAGRVVLASAVKPPGTGTCVLAYCCKNRGWYRPA